MAENLDVPARGIKQAEQHFDRGRFARTVGAQQAEDFAAAHFKIDIIHRPRLGPAPEILEDFGQAREPRRSAGPLSACPLARERTAQISATALMR